MIKDKARSLVVAGIILSSLLFLSHSTGPLDGLTGAPGDFDCTFCHAPGGSSQTGNLQIIGFPSVITPLTTYPIEVRVNKTSGIARTAGFEMVVLEGNMSTSGSVGSWTTSDPFVTVSNSGNRTYVKHFPQEYEYDDTFVGPETIVYEADWTAPAVVNDNIWVYAIANIGGFPAGTGGDLIVTSVVSNLPLPVELEDFRIARQADGLPRLAWQTNSETNSSEFLIMRSSNGRTFETIGKVQAAGFSASPLQYSFVDKHPLATGVVFYKLKMVDLDEMFHYSRIVSLNAGSGTDVKMIVFPNPLNKGQCIFVEVATPRDLKDLSISVRDQTGSVVMHSNDNADLAPAGMYRVAMDPYLLSPGIYYVVLKAHDQPRIVRKLIIAV